MAATRRLRFGLLGSDCWARLHASALSAAGEAQFIGIWDCDPARTAAVATQYGVAAYDDADALLGDVDAVSIALPPDLQTPMAVRAVKAGRHLLLHKPPALPTSSADDLLAALADKRIASVAFFRHHFAPAAAQVIRTALATGGWHGARGSASMAVSGSTWPCGASPLWDLGPDMVSLFLSVLGPAREVTAVSGSHQSWHVLVRHESDAVSSLMLSLDIPRALAGRDVVFLGRRGTLHVPVASADPVPAMIRAVSELARASAGLGSDHGCDIRLGLQVGSVLAAATESAATGRTIHVQRSAPASATS